MALRRAELLQEVGDGEVGELALQAAGNGEGLELLGECRRHGRSGPKFSANPGFNRLAASVIPV